MVFEKVLELLDTALSDDIACVGGAGLVLQNQLLEGFSFRFCGIVWDLKLEVGLVLPGHVCGLCHVEVDARLHFVGANTVRRASRVRERQDLVDVNE